MCNELCSKPQELLNIFAEPGGFYSISTPHHFFFFFFFFGHVRFRVGLQVVL